MREIKGRNSKCMRARDEWEILLLREVSSISGVDLIVNLRVK